MSTFRFTSLVFRTLALTSLYLFACGTKETADDDAQGPVGGINNNDVPKLKTFEIKDTLDVKFFIAADVHFQSDYKYDSLHVCWGFQDDYLPHYTAVVKDINDHCTDCVGGVLVGDMARIGQGFSGHWDDTIRTFRAVYEHDNPNGVREDCCGKCKYCKTPGGVYGQVRLPMFVGLGNHDDPSNDYPEDAQRYVRDRVSGSDALYMANHGEKSTSSYYRGKGSDLYAWEWGSFHFVWLGIWAFYGGHSDSDGTTVVSHDKIAWLKEHLAAIGKEKPIVLFQHFGWDGLSLDQTWWTPADIDRLGDVLCDREVKVGDSGPCDHPYNVLAIFSGHQHQQQLHRHPCARGTYKEGDGWTSCKEHLPFVNVVVDDGRGAKGTDGNSGYDRVWLRVDSTGASMMTVDRIGLDWEDGTTTRDDCVTYQDHSRHLNSGSEWPYEKTFTTSFIRFAQGEPNNNAMDGENCAEIKKNGRYNDVTCDKQRPVLCKNGAGSDWKLTSASTYNWRESFAACRALSPDYKFTEPKNVAEQRASIDLLHHHKVSQAWVNYTDQLEEGKWTEASWVLATFSDGEPNNGAGQFERLDGENCALRRSNGKLNDANCGAYLSDIFCHCESPSAGWYPFHVPQGLSWYEGRSFCASKGCSFSFPGDIDEFKAIKTNSSLPHWVSLNDLDKERVWVDITYPQPLTGTVGKPWILFGAGWALDEPQLGGAQGGHCAAMTKGERWNNITCQGSHAYAFACRSHEKGQWKRSTNTSAKWVDGFEACRKLGLDYSFAVPFNSSENEKLKTVAAGTTVWLNYTDVERTGVFVQGFWINWNSGEPNNANGDEDCVIVKPSTARWNDFKCSTSSSDTILVCREVSGAWNATHGFKSGDELELCENNNQYATYPTCPSENAAFVQVMGQNFQGWIPFNDRNVEGHFQPWWLK